MVVLYSRILSKKRNRAKKSPKNHRSIFRQIIETMTFPFDLVNYPVYDDYICN